MTLDETLNDDLMRMLIPEKREKIKKLIEEYHGKFFTGSVTKEEVAMFSFMVASCMRQDCAKECASFIEETFNLY